MDDYITSLERRIDLTNANIFEVSHLSVDDLRRSLKSVQIHIFISDSNSYCLKAYRFFKRNRNYSLPFFLYCGKNQSDYNFWEPEAVLSSNFFRNLMMNRPIISPPIMFEKTPIIQVFSNPLLRTKIFDRLDHKSVFNFKVCDPLITYCLR